MQRKSRQKKTESEGRLSAQIARGLADRTAASAWDDPLVTDFRTELEAAWRRGNGRCGVCGGRVSFSRPYRHPMEATLDHRTPLSKGGGDDRANLQIAHRRCNSRKGSR